VVKQSIAIPDGYAATKAQFAAGWLGPALIELNVAGQKQSSPGGGTVTFAQHTGSIPIAILAESGIGGFHCVITVECTEAGARSAWQLDTWEAIWQGWLRLKADADARAAQASIARGVGIQGRNPAKNPRSSAWNTSVRCSR
jgi:hypothetical protein